MTLATQLAKFASIGAVATLVHVSVALLCASLLSFPPLAANSAGFAAAVMLSYFGQGQLAFETKLHHRIHGPRFLATALTGFVISSSQTQILVVWLGAPFMVGMAVVALAVPASTYLLCRFWVFRPA